MRKLNKEEVELIKRVIEEAIPEKQEYNQSVINPGGIGDAVNNAHVHGFNQAIDEFNSNFERILHG